MATYTTITGAATSNSSIPTDQMKNDQCDDDDSRDVVDYCATLNGRRPTTDAKNGPTTKSSIIHQHQHQHHHHHQHQIPAKPPPKKTGNADDPPAPPSTRRKSSFPSFDNLPPLFHFQRKRGGSAPVIHAINAPPAPVPAKDARPPFVKSSSIARLFGNTYSTKQYRPTTTDSAPPANGGTPPIGNGTRASSYATRTNAGGGGGGEAAAQQLPAPPTEPPHQQQRPRPAISKHTERFQACAAAEHDFTEAPSLRSASSSSSSSSSSQAAPAAAADADPFSIDSTSTANPFRSLSRGLGRLFWKKSYSVSISEPDPEFKVAYLGNVLTGWAKGDSCMEKPLATLWRNYTQNYKPDVSMRVRICSSGLKATTRQHGLTEYWSHRITHCSAPKNYPKVFCWIYRHEGRKLKHELRCHAVLCAKETIAESIAKTLQDNLTRALKEFKRDKINKQNARLSLVNSVYENPSMPQRKIMLSVGSANYRPPLERSKSAPRLMVIEETGEELDEEDADDASTTTNHPAKEPQRACCGTIDPLYPAMTLGRRRCRRGHSIRRTGQRAARAKLAPPTPPPSASTVHFEVTPTAASNPVLLPPVAGADEQPELRAANAAPAPLDRLRHSSDSGDDLDKILLRKDYDTASPLADELMSYFDMKFSTKCAASMDDLQHAPDAADDDDDAADYTTKPHHFDSATVRQSLSLDNLDAYSDDDADELFFSQDHILSTLARTSSHPRLNSAAAAAQRTTSRLSSSGAADDDDSCPTGTGFRNENDATKERDRRRSEDGSSPLSSVCSSNAANDQPHSDRNDGSNDHHHNNNNNNNNNNNHHHHHHHHHNGGLKTTTTTLLLDSDEGSISSGFDTASTVTTNNADALIPLSGKSDAEQNQNSLECSSIRTTPLATVKPVKPYRRQRRRSAAGQSDDESESDCSDESGYVEYQDAKPLAAKPAPQPTTRQLVTQHLI